MKRIVNFLLTVLISLLPLWAFAQDAEMADTMRSEGKIYVVVSIILVIFFGIIFYLVRIDQKVSQAEKRIAEKK